MISHHAAAEVAEILAAAGHRVRCATHAAAALLAARSHRFDVIFIAADPSIGDAEGIVHQIRALYPIRAIGMFDQSHPARG